MQNLILLLVLLTCCKKGNVDKKETNPVIWETQMPAEIYYSSPALSIDEKTVYTGTSTGLLGNHRTGYVFVAIDAASGKENWQLQLGTNEVRSTPLIAPDNSVYFTVELRDPSSGTLLGDELWHVTAEGVLLWKFNINPGSGIVYALQTGSKGLDSLAPWPKFRYDNQNQGRKR